MLHVVGFLVLSQYCDRETLTWEMLVVIARSKR